MQNFIILHKSSAYTGYPFKDFFFIVYVDINISFGKYL